MLSFTCFIKVCATSSTVIIIPKGADNSKIIHPLFLQEEQYAEIAAKYDHVDSTMRSKLKAVSILLCNFVIFVEEVDVIKMLH